MTEETALRIAVALEEFVVIERELMAHMKQRDALLELEYQLEQQRRISNEQ
jgi:hypothetical protein